MIHIGIYKNFNQFKIKQQLLEYFALITVIMAIEYHCKLLKYYPTNGNAMVLHTDLNRTAFVGRVTL